MLGLHLELVTLHGSFTISIEEHKKDIECSVLSRWPKWTHMVIRWLERTYWALIECFVWHTCLSLPVTQYVRVELI
jgi:hypothetical protein